MRQTRCYSDLIIIKQQLLSINLNWIFLLVVYREVKCKLSSGQLREVWNKWCGDIRRGPESCWHWPWSSHRDTLRTERLTNNWGRNKVAPNINSKCSTVLLLAGGVTLWHCNTVTLWHCDGVCNVCRSVRLTASCWTLWTLGQPGQVLPAPPRGREDDINTNNNPPHSTAGLSRNCQLSRDRWEVWEV